MFKVQRRPWQAIGSGVFWSLLGAMAGGTILVAETWLTATGPLYLSPWVTLIGVGATLFGGLVSGMQTEGRGWLKGLTVGMIAGAILLFQWNWLTGGLIPWPELVFEFFSMSGWGALGGSIGINLWSYFQKKRTIILRRKAFF